MPRAWDQPPSAQALAVLLLVVAVALNGESIEDAVSVISAAVAH